MRREVCALFTESDNKLKALIYVFLQVFGKISVLYSNIVIGGDNKHTAAAAAGYNSQPTKTKLTARGGDGGGSGGSRIWNIVFFEKVQLPHIVEKLPKYYGAHTIINQQSI
jgi:hypothetical protein